MAETKDNDCPHCHAHIDAATHLEKEASPNAGDFSLCLYCGELSIFNADQTLRALDEFEKLKMESNPEYPKIRRYQAAIRQLILSRKSRL